MNLKLAVDLLSIQLATLAGEKQEAAFFFPVPDSVTSPSSCLADQLNNHRFDFLPCRVAHRTSLIRVEWIAYVTLDAAQIDWQTLEEAGAISKPVELELVTGERLAGALMVEGSEYERRVSDYLNRTSVRFILLRSGSEAIYVNRRAVGLIRLEESE